MHQFPRALKAASAASSPRSQPVRSNNDRDDLSGYTSSNVSDILNDDRLYGDDEFEEDPEELKARAAHHLKLTVRVRKSSQISDLALTPTDYVLCSNSLSKAR